MISPLAADMTTTDDAQAAAWLASNGGAQASDVITEHIMYVGVNT